MASRKRTGRPLVEDGNARKRDEESVAKRTPGVDSKLAQTILDQLVEL